MRICITGVNVNNESLLSDIAGDAGFQGLLKNHMNTMATMHIGSVDSCIEAGISLGEIDRMIGRFVIHGFGVSVDHQI